MEHIYKESSDNFSILIKADINSEEEKKLIEGLGHAVTSNLCLKDTKLRNTCLALLNTYITELLKNLADYSSINDIEMDPNLRDQLDDFSNVNLFSLKRE